MQAKVAVFGTLKFAPEGVAAILPHLKAMIDASYKHDGCIAYHAAQDVFEPGVIRISELWPDQESLQRHIDAPHLPAWFAAVRDCGVLESKYSIFDVTGERVV